jgi:Na+/H+ antiporter NhaB
MLNKIRINGPFKGVSTIIADLRLSKFADELTWVKVIIAIMFLLLIIFIAVSSACGEITLSHRDADHDHHITEDMRKNNVY